MMLLFWIPILILVYYFLKQSGFQTKKQDSGALLDRRLASGEISIEEYRAIKSAQKE